VSVDGTRLDGEVDARNEWTLHAFGDPVDRSYAREMTPANVEATSLKAKTAASAAG